MYSRVLEGTQEVVRPGLFSWMLGVTGAMLLLGVTLSIFVVATELYYIATVALFRQSVASADFKQFGAFYRAYLARTEVRALRGMLGTSSRQRQQKIEQLLGLIMGVLNSPADEEFKNLDTERGILTQALYFSKIVGDGELSVADKQLKELEFMINILKSTLINKKETLQELDTLRDQRMLLAADLAEFLGVPADAVEKEGNYTTGILATLPQIEGIPDNITDLAVFRDALIAAGGSVKLESNDPAGEFNTKLSRFLESSLPVATASSNALAKMHLLEKEVEIAQRNLHETSLNVRRAFGTIATQLLRSEALLPEVYHSLLPDWVVDPRG